MGVLEKVLEYAQEGVPVPAELFGDLTPSEQKAVRNFENSRQMGQQWREITLSILHTATDLSRGRDKSVVLDQLVVSCRSIIQSDVAYISINKNGTRYTQVIASSGVITEQFRNVIVPLGVGITGRVAAEKQTAWTSHHQTDPEVSHVPHIDAAVAAEGLHAFLGAPLANARGMQGALMVGDRRPRNYTADEIIVLDLLASLASVVLDTSQLINDLEENLTLLKQAHRESRQQVHQLETLAEVDLRLIDGLAHGARVTTVRDVIKDELDCEVWFWRDDRPYPVSSLQPVRMEDDEAAQMRRLIAQSQTTGEIAVGDGMSALAMSLDGRHLGAVCVNVEVEDTQKSILQRGSQTFATILLFKEAVSEAEGRQIDDLFRKLLSGVPADDDVARIKKATGLDLNNGSRHCLVAMRSVGPAPSARAMNAELGKRGHLFWHEDYFCAVVRVGKNVDEDLADVYELGRQTGARFFVGAVDVPKAGIDFSDLFSRAAALSSGMQSLDVAYQAAARETFGSVGLLLSAGDKTVSHIIGDELGGLLAYDEKHSTSLTETAAAYFDNSRNVGDTASTLFVHENTVRQRLGRIADVLGPGWDRGVRALDVQLALRAWKLREGSR